MGEVLTFHFAMSLVTCGKTNRLRCIVMTSRLHAIARLIGTTALALCAAAPSVNAAETAAIAPVEVDSVVIRLLEEAEIPAQEAGVVTGVAVREGQRVKQGELLAQIDDQVPRVAAEAAKALYDVARAKATNDVRIRFAQKSLEVSEAELRRSTESIERFAKSVSQSQLDVEQLTVQKNRLEAEQANHEQEIATLEMKVKENELTAARAEISRRRIVAPIDGVIVQVYVRKGEWVEAGKQALRIVSVDRLKAEGFVAADQAGPKLSGAPVRLTVERQNEKDTFKGSIVFVSPEVDPITGQVRVWAEIDNRDGRLRPGQAAKMIVGQAK
jgi:multidrug efflux pump subunit AcrA (membrane-fusion protein)